MKKVSTLFLFRATVGSRLIEAYVCGDTLQIAIEKFGADRPGYSITAIQNLGRVIL